MKEFDFNVHIIAQALRVKAETEEDAKCIVFDSCKNHDFLVIDTIESVTLEEREVNEDVGM